MGINVVLTAHAQMRKFEQPDELGAYDRWELKLGKKTGSQTAPLVKEWADMVLFANYKTFAVAVDKDGKKFKGQGGERVMYTSHHSCWDAKNREGLAPELPFDYSQIAHLFSAQTAQTAQPAVSVQQTKPEPVQQPAPTTSSAEPPKMPESVSEIKPEEFETVVERPLNIPQQLPQALKDLMKSEKVDESDIRLVVSQRGYFPQDTPITNYPPDFIEGVLIGAWSQMLPLIKENQKVPF